MDFKRILLISALAVVGYLLILQWSQDHNNSPSSHTKETLPATSLQERNDTPSISPESEHSFAKFSDAPKVNNSDESIENSSDIRIFVTTDVLSLKIDLHGGNITYLALPAYSEKQGSTSPFVLLNNTKALTYVAQSGLIGKDIADEDEVLQYTSVVPKYVLQDGKDTLVVDLHLALKKVDVIKRYTFTRGHYSIKLDYIIRNISQYPWQGNFYAQLKRDSSADPGLEGSHGTSIYSYLGAAVCTSEEKFKKISFSDFGKKLLNSVVKGGYAAILQHYFVVAWVPEQNTQYTYTTRKVHENNIVGFYSKGITISPGKMLDTSAVLYAGPKIERALETLAPGLSMTIDYGWLWFLAAPMFAILAFLHKLLGNWGWSIIALTALIKLLFFPLSATSYRSMAKIRALQPKMASLKERYGNDRQKMSQELMKLYKKEKVNPMGGCLPIIVQMPFFIALYEVLMEAVQLRHAPWILWIHDLSRMDPYFILPIIMGGLMFLQQHLTPAPADPTQARVMRFMPLIFTVFFLWFPAGLVIYWVTNNFLSIIQQWWITRQYDNMLQSKKKSL